MANPTGKSGPHPKPWKDAIMRAIKRREQDDPRALERLATSLLRKVEEGDVSAIREFGDRIDGKVTQTIAGDEDGAAIAMTVITGVPRADD